MVKTYYVVIIIGVLSSCNSDVEYLSSTSPTDNRGAGDDSKNIDDSNDDSECGETVCQIGPRGLQGERGKIGLPGLNGRDGINGIDGEDGLDGISGTDGVDGINGLNGKNGKDGAPGQKGERGQAGQDGRNGVDGSSCMCDTTVANDIIHIIDGRVQATFALPGVFPQYQIDQMIIKPIISIGVPRIILDEFDIESNGEWFEIKLDKNVRCERGIKNTAANDCVRIEGLEFDVSRDDGSLGPYGAQTDNRFLNGLVNVGVVGGVFYLYPGHYHISFVILETTFDASTVSTGSHKYIKDHISAEIRGYVKRLGNANFEPKPIRTKYADFY